MFVKLQKFSNKYQERIISSLIYWVDRISCCYPDNSVESCIFQKITWVYRRGNIFFLENSESRFPKNMPWCKSILLLIFWVCVFFCDNYFSVTFTRNDNNFYLQIRPRYFEVYRIYSIGVYTKRAERFLFCFVDRVTIYCPISEKVW